MEIKLIVLEQDYEDLLCGLKAMKHVLDCKMPIDNPLRKKTSAYCDLLEATIKEIYQ